MQSQQHKTHIAKRMSHANCPECRADNSRRFAVKTPFVHLAVPAKARHEYFTWLKSRLDAIRTGTNGGDTTQARAWYRYDFVPALHARITSHIPDQGGRKHAPEYAKYHLATYGNDFRFLHNY